MSEQERTFTSVEACRLAGITFRQLDYWDRSGVIRPTVAGRMGNGYARRYTVGDLERLMLVRMLIDAGLRLERCRLVLAARKDATDDGYDPEWLFCSNSFVGWATADIDPVDQWLENTDNPAVVIVSYSAVRTLVRQALNRHDLTAA